MNRNTKGIIGFLILSIIFGILTIPIMVFREYYQWKFQNTTGWNFEWDDIIRYGITTSAGCVIHYGTVIYFLI